MSDSPPEDPVDNFLAHYGVKGMRWGVKKGKGAESFSKAVKKHKKLEKKSSKLAKKGAKLQYKGAKWGDPIKLVRGMKKSYKATIFGEKARKWELAMAKELSTVKVSDLSPEQKEAGKRYIELLSQD